MDGWMDKKKWKKIWMVDGQTELKKIDGWQNGQEKIYMDGWMDGYI